MGPRWKSLLIVLFVVVATACSGGGETPPTDEPTGEPTAEPTEGLASIDSVLEACQAPYVDSATAMVDTSEFASEEPWTLGVSAGYLLQNAWIAYFYAGIQYGVSLDPRYTDTIVTDAGFDPGKQVSDIQDLIVQEVDGIIYWPVDNAALQGALEEANAAGIPTLNVAQGYADFPGITANVQIDYYKVGAVAAAHFAHTLNGEGKILQVLPIEGTDAAIQQDAALRCVLGFFPGIELLDSQFGNFNAPDSKTVAEAWVQRFSEVDGVFSVYAEQSLGVSQAFEEAGRLGEIEFPPNDEVNGWLKFLVAHPEKNHGIVTFPPTFGVDAIEVMTQILQGESVAKGLFLGSEYLTPEEGAALVQPDEPDSYWPNEYPQEFQP